MKKALISPLEVSQTGYRVAEVKNIQHEMAEPFFWMDCEDNVIADAFWYDPQDKQFKEIPILPPEQPKTTGSQDL